MLGDNIRLLRSVRGISQVELGEKLNVSKQSISNWENGNIQPSIEMLMKIADFFSVSTDFLLGLDNRTSIIVDGLSTEELSHIRVIIDDLVAAKRRMGLKKNARRVEKADNDFVIIDIETTGLSVENDEILEIGAIRIVNGKTVEEYERLIAVKTEIAQNISELTGITQEQVKENGKPINEALPSFMDFVKGSEVAGYNVNFDHDFLLAECSRQGIDITKIKFTDVMTIVKSKLKGMRSYNLESVAKRLGITTKQQHRALSDCYLLYQVYCKLNEK